MTTATVSLYESIAAIDLNAVPIVSTDRHIDRKQQAKLARQLFKSLGLKGISVTTPNYSMAHVVDVRVPEEPHPGWEGYEQWQHHSYGDMPDEVPAKMANKRRYAAEQKVAAILAKAFPKHDDRSDSQSDYFDSCWSVN